MSIRLINTMTLKMSDFTGEVPEYAILSHTWIDNEEVSFQEFTGIFKDLDRPLVMKSGYRKILETCKKAKSHGFQYVWIDTCCIDKTSSAELSEAINSMFQWYQNAKLCYVYLVDVPELCNGIEAFKSCRWFTRGWCLQELLAPSDLRFYNQTWSYIGSKLGLKHTISDITGIDEAVLDGTCLLHTLPIAQRMSWAAKRITTRVEDIAYCLLGIFGIAMPLLYGEGEKAYLRLQEEIIRRSDDLSIFCHIGETVHGVDNDSDKRIRYRDLFSRSPKAFASCGDIIFVASRSISSRSISRRSFEMTNVGLHFKKAELFLCGADLTSTDNTTNFGFYVILLECIHDIPYSYSTGHQIQCMLILRKVGSELFVNVDPIVRMTNPTRIGNDARCTTEEVYIIPVIHSDLRAKLDNTHHEAIRFTVEGMESLQGPLGDVLQDPIPRDQWDASERKFLTTGGLFEGYLKVIPSVAQKRWNNKEAGLSSFYVVCGQEINLPCLVWLRLFSESDWREYKNLGRLNNLWFLAISQSNKTDNAQDEISIDGTRIHARSVVNKTEEDKILDFTIQITFKDNP